MKDIWIAAAGFALGWLMSKTWQDPACRIGLVLFLVITTVMALVFALAVVGHGDRHRRRLTMTASRRGDPLTPRVLRSRWRPTHHAHRRGRGAFVEATDEVPSAALEWTRQRSAASRARWRLELVIADEESTGLYLRSALAA
jgi:hypothetical protein